jgi:carboxypeptidase Q
VLIFDPRELALHTEPDAHRLTDEEVEERTKTPDPSHPGFAGGGRPGSAVAQPGEFTPSSLSTAAPSGRILRNQVNAFLKEEGVAVALTPGYNGDGGTIFAFYGGSQNPKDPVGPPMAAITPEQYNRICRLLEHGITPKLTFDIETEYQKDDQMGFNVVGEIRGTAKADEVVMVVATSIVGRVARGQPTMVRARLWPWRRCAFWPHYTSQWLAPSAWPCGAAKKRDSTVRWPMCNSTLLRATP